MPSGIWLMLLTYATPPDYTRVFFCYNAKGGKESITLFTVSYVYVQCAYIYMYLTEVFYSWSSMTI